MSEDVKKAIPAEADDWQKSWPVWVVDAVRKMEAIETRNSNLLPNPTPPWVVSIGKQLFGVANRSFEKSRFDESGPLFLGRMIGHLIEVAKSLDKVLENFSLKMAEVDAELKRKLHPITYARLLRDAEKNGNEFTRLMEAVDKSLRAKQRVIARTMAIAREQPVQESAEFFQGVSEALAKPTYDQAGKLASKDDSAQLYVLLFFNWRKLRKFNTVTDLYKWACKRLGNDEVGDLDSFKRFCHRHKIQLHPRGRPRKKRT